MMGESIAVPCSRNKTGPYTLCVRAGSFFTWRASAGGACHDVISGGRRWFIVPALSLHKRNDAGRRGGPASRDITQRHAISIMPRERRGNRTAAAQSRGAATPRAGRHYPGERTRRAKLRRRVSRGAIAPRQRKAAGPRPRASHGRPAGEWTRRAKLRRRVSRGAIAPRQRKAAGPRPRASPAGPPGTGGPFSISDRASLPPCGPAGRPRYRRLGAEWYSPAIFDALPAASAIIF